MFVRYDSKESYVKIIRWIYVPSFLAFGYNSLYPKKERKGAFFMLNYFNDQIGLYVLAGVFSICLFGKLVTNNIYKRMIKQSKDLLVTKDKRLRLIAESYASYSKTKGTMKNLPVFIEKNIYSYKRLGVNPLKLDTVVSQGPLICFLCGLSATFISFWNGESIKYMVLQFAMGVILGIIMAIMDGILDTDRKREMAFVHIQNYLENFMPVEKEEKKEVPLGQAVTMKEGNSEKTLGMEKTLEVQNNVESEKKMQDDLFVKRKEERRRERKELFGYGKEQEKSLEETVAVKNSTEWLEEQAEEKKRLEMEALKKHLVEVAVTEENSNETIVDKQKPKLQFTKEQETLIREIINEYLS